MKTTTLLRRLVIGFLLAHGGGLAQASELTDAMASGTAAMARHDADAAIASFGRVIGLNPKDPAGYYFRGQAYGEKGDLTPAIADFTTALELRPQIAELYWVRAGAYYKARDLDRSLADTNAAIRLKPRFAMAICFRGVLVSEQGKFPEAIPDFTQTIQLTPGNYQAYYYRSNCYQSLGQAKLAIADLEKALQLNPDSEDVLNNLAWLRATSTQAELRQGASALQYSTKACEITHWKNAGYLDTLAAAYAEIGDFEAAVKWQEKAVALMPAGEHAEELRAHLKLFQAKQPFHEALLLPAKPAAQP